MLYSPMQVGKQGEEQALLFLQKNGFTILHHHYTTHWGEIDIIAKKAQTIHFIEVKTRIGIKKGQPYEAVTFRKVQSLMRAIQYYLKQFDYKKYKYSLDVISIVMNPELEVLNLSHFLNITS